MSFPQRGQPYIAPPKEGSPQFIILSTFSNESGLGFITSDVPVVKYNQWFLERGYRHPFGFGHMGCQCFVPLSAKICFCLFDDIVYKNQFGNKGRIRLYDEKDVEELNENTNPPAMLGRIE